MNQRRALYSALFVLASSLSLATADGRNHVSGLGIPRETDHLCVEAGKKIIERLGDPDLKSADVKLSCINSNSDVGEHMPRIEASFAEKYAIEVEIGERRYAIDQCQEDLINLKSKAGSDKLILEAECLSGTETVYPHTKPQAKALPETKKFHQAWISKLVPEPQKNIPDAGANSSRIEEDRADRNPMLRPSNPAIFKKPMEQKTE